MAFNAFAYSLSPVTTVTVSEKTKFENTFEFEGFVVRDEKEIENPSDGTVISLVRDGKRVGKGDPIAVVCKNKEEADAYKELENAKAELERYQNLNNTGGMQDLNAEKLNSEISDAYAGIMDSVTSGNFDGLDESIAAFNEKNATKQILISGNINVSPQMTALDKEIKKLEAKNIASSPVSAPDSGYYINSVDGYESTLKYDEIKSVNSQTLKKALDSKPKQKKNNSFGKLVSSYRWYIAGIVDSEHSTDFPADGSVKVNFPDSGIENVKMKVESIRKANGSMVVVLSSDLMNENFADMRKETVQVVTKSGEGFRIPSDAVRFDKNDKSGIFVLRGKIITFVSADILYSDKDYTVVDSTEGGGIALYDEVIIKGKDIRDGKVIR